jgi:hypothetical protein
MSDVTGSEPVPFAIAGAFALTEQIHNLQEQIDEILQPLFHQGAVIAVGVVIAAAREPRCFTATQFSDKFLQRRIWATFELCVKEQIAREGALAEQPIVARSDLDGERVLCVEAQPHPIFGRSFIVVAVHSVTECSEILQQMVRLTPAVRGVLIQQPWRAGQEASLPDTPDLGEAVRPLIDFLTSTLVEKSTMRGRNNCRYLTVRAWRAAIKPYQIEALKALKRDPCDVFVDFIAREMLLEVDKLMGLEAIETIVPVPSSGSGTQEGLSVMIAMRIGEILGKPVARALAAKVQRKSSHPKNNVTRPPIRVVEEITTTALVVDDVATSGRHMEEALTLLRKTSKGVLGVAWIGGSDGTAAETLS